MIVGPECCTRAKEWGVIATSEALRRECGRVHSGVTVHLNVKVLAD
jgi:hypothetical protein